MHRTALALSALVALLPVHHSAFAAPGGSVSTQEVDCYELNEFRRASYSAVAAALPEGWQPLQIAPGVAQTLFLDYVCEELSVDGLPGRRTVVSMLAATNASRTDGTPGRRNWLLWHGTTNPLLVQRLAKVGLDSRYVPRSEASLTPTGPGTARVEMTFVDDRPDAGLDYARVSEVVEPDPATTDAPGGVFYAVGDEGVVRLAFQNSTTASTRARTAQAFEEGSLPRSFGIASIPPTSSPSLTFTRGSWTSTAEVVPS